MEDKERKTPIDFGVKRSKVKVKLTMTGVFSAKIGCAKISTRTVFRYDRVENTQG